MKKVKIVIERSNDLFSAYAENVNGVYGAGDTVAEAKDSIIKSIELLKKYNKTNVPAILKSEYSLVFRFDVESFLNYYKGIFTNAALERITGINQKQFQHYATGLKKPRETQIKKIETALHILGRELISVEL
ncbi:helix-turn-helix transcriptional regulator [soil metagenome]